MHIAIVSYGYLLYISNIMNEKNQFMNTKTHANTLKISVLQPSLPDHLWLSTEEGYQHPLFNYSSYTMLFAIAKYGYGHPKNVAEYYLSNNGETKLKAKRMRQEGSFFSAVFRGDFEGALNRSSNDLYDALCKGLTNREIQL